MGRSEKRKAMASARECEQLGSRLFERAPFVLFLPKEQVQRGENIDGLVQHDVSSPLIRTHANQIFRPRIGGNQLPEPLHFAQVLWRANRGDQSAEAVENRDWRVVALRCQA